MEILSQGYAKDVYIPVNIAALLELIVLNV
jgi:hypothetical protein